MSFCKLSFTLQLITMPNAPASLRSNTPFCVRPHRHIESLRRVPGKIPQIPKTNVSTGNPMTKIQKPVHTIGATDEALITKYKDTMPTMSAN